MLLIDAANVVGSRPDGWWRDRPAAAARLVEQVRAATAGGRLATPVVVVVEGTARSGVDAGTARGVEVVHAPGEGDDTIAALAAAATDQVVLVSADRQLGERCRAVGSTVVGPRWLLDQLRPSAGGGRRDGMGGEPNG